MIAHRVGKYKTASLVKDYKLSSLIGLESLRRKGGPAFWEALQATSERVAPSIASPPIATASNRFACKSAQAGQLRSGAPAAVVV